MDEVKAFDFSDAQNPDLFVGEVTFLADRLEEYTGCTPGIRIYTREEDGEVSFLRFATAAWEPWKK